MRGFSFLYMINWIDILFITFLWVCCLYCTIQSSLKRCNIMQQKLSFSIPKFILPEYLNIQFPFFFFFFFTLLFYYWNRKSPFLSGSASTRKLFFGSTNYSSATWQVWTCLILNFLSWTCVGSFPSIEDAICNSVFILIMIWGLYHSKMLCR